MCEQNIRYWFSATHKTNGRILHIISARSIARARACFGPASDSYRFEQLTWSDVSKRSGFASPTVNQETTFATGGLLTEWRGKVISIEVAD